MITLRIGSVILLVSKATLVEALDRHLAVEPHQEKLNRADFVNMLLAWQEDLSYLLS